MKQGDDESGSALKLIAGFKLLQAALLIAAGAGALGLVEPDRQQAIIGWLDSASLREGRRLTSELALKAGALLGATSVARLVGIAIGCFVYGAVFVVEATGLWLGKRWAEYLTIAVTASLLPFEIVELMDHVSTPRVLVLVVNLVVLAYLGWHLARHRRRPDDRPAHGA